MTDNTTLIQAFAKRLMKNQAVTGSPSAKMEHACEEVHPKLDHSQWEFGNKMKEDLKADMPAYQGGAASVFGQGTKSVEPETGKSLPGVYCSWCHQGPFGRYIPYRGQQVCTKCWAESGPQRPFTK